ncbi:hypothetical protein R3P38DRAFT_1669193, partial [Favolaschia claudopus]
MRPLLLLLWHALMMPSEYGASDCNRNHTASSLHPSNSPPPSTDSVSVCVWWTFLFGTMVASVSCFLSSYLDVALAARLLRCLAGTMAHGILVSLLANEA